MNCPYCGNEMEAGYLQGQSMILWDTELQDGIVNLSDRGFFSGAKLDQAQPNPILLLRRL